MASPQIRDGGTIIAHEIIEALARVHLPAAAWCILMVIFRKTYGFHKVMDRIPLSQIVELTGLDNKQVCRTLARLKKDGIITRNEKGETSFCKDWESWNLSTRDRRVAKLPLPKMRTASVKNANNPVPKMPHSNSNQIVLSNSRPQSSVDNLLERAAGLPTDSPHWDQLIADLKAYGYQPRIDGEVAQFYERGWRVKAVGGWVDWNIAAMGLRDHLTFTKK